METKCKQCGVSISSHRTFCSQKCQRARTIVGAVNARRMTNEETLAKYTKKMDSGCHEWTGNLTKDGYGLTERQTPIGEIKSAHRLAFYVKHGYLPNNLQLDHLCRNRKCVNPDHLEPVTPAENTRRALLAEPHYSTKKTHCKYGHPLDGDNLRIIIWRGIRMRRCKTCESNRTRARYQKKKLAKKVNEKL